MTDTGPWQRLRAQRNVHEHELYVGPALAAIGTQQALDLTVIVGTVRNRARGLVDQAAHRMVVQVRADTGQVRNDLDTEAPQLIGRPDPGQHQQLRRTDGARGEHDLPPTVCDERLVPDAVLDSPAAVVVQ
jgi:hypothetical protein